MAWVWKPGDRITAERLNEMMGMTPELFFDVVHKYFETTFESIDGYNTVVTGTGHIVLEPNRLELHTGVDVGSVVEIYKHLYIHRPLLWWNRTTKFRTSLDAAYSHQQNIWIGCGRPGIYNHLGIKNDGLDWYGTVGNGTAETTVLLFTLPDPVLISSFMAVLTPGVDAKFYAEDHLYGTITTGLPITQSYADRILEFMTENTTAAERIVRMTDWKYIQF